MHVRALPGRHCGVPAQFDRPRGEADGGPRGRCARRERRMRALATEFQVQTFVFPFDSEEGQSINISAVSTLSFWTSAQL